MNNNKQTGEETMNESYKDKFNAQMKKAGIDSLDDLKSDAEKKAFFKAVDKSHDAKNESLTEELVAIAEGMKEGKGSLGKCQGKPGSFVAFVFVLLLDGIASEEGRGWAARMSPLISAKQGLIDDAGAVLARREALDVESAVIGCSSKPSGP